MHPMPIVHVDCIYVHVSVLTFLSFKVCGECVCGMFVGKCVCVCVDIVGSYIMQEEM